MPKRSNRPTHMRNLVDRCKPTECQRCEVICEWVVHPASCLREGCRYAYSYELDGSTYFGCIAKVFSVEIDTDSFTRQPRRDVYGAIKAQRPPRPECDIELEQAYRAKYSWQECANPTFLQHPDDYAPAAIRLMVNGSPNRRR